MTLTVTCIPSERAEENYVFIGEQLSTEDSFCVKGVSLCSFSLYMLEPHQAQTCAGPVHAATELFVSYLVLLFGPVVIRRSNYLSVY